MNPITPRRLTLPLALALALVVPACLTESRRAADDATTTADTATPDAVDDTHSDDDAVAGDSVEPECFFDDDCIPAVTIGLPGCSRYVCDLGTCGVESIGEGDPCPDGDACTEDGVCQGGQCTGGGSVACASEDPCTVVSGCEPSSGCQYAPADPGTTCDDGVGRSAGDCAAGWFGPLDRCGEAGACVGGIFEAPEAYPLEGKWYAVMATDPRATASTLRARLAFGKDGGLGISDAQSTRPAWANDLNGAGYACIAPEGRVDFGRPSHNYSGWLTEGGDALVFLGYTASEIGIAVRSGGGPDAVDGTYQALATGAVDGASGPPALASWVGALSFADGCLTSDAKLAVSQAALDAADVFLSADGEPCFTSDGGDVVVIEHVVLAHPDESDEQGTRSTWRGVVAQDGDLLVLTRDGASADTPDYGIIVLVRHASDPPLPIGGPWSLVAQRGGLTTSTHWGALAIPDQAATGVTGWLAVPGVTEVGATIDRGWAFFALDGSYSHRLVAGLETLHDAGWQTRRGDLIMAWAALPIADALGPRFLGTTPAVGSLLLMVRARVWAADPSGVSPGGGGGEPVTP